MSYGDEANQTSLGIAVDSSSKVLLTGYITGTTNFGGVDLTTAGANDRNVFLAKFAGTMPLYSAQWGDSSIDEADSVAVDADNNIILSGVELGTVNFGGGDISNVGAANGFLVKLSSAGKHLWSKGYGNADTTLIATAVAVDPKTKEVVLGITFQGSVDFGKGKLVSFGKEDFVLSKFSP